MESIANLLDKISINNLDVGSEQWVDVTYINNPHSFYVRLVDYRTFLPILNTYDDSLLITELHIGSVVVYKSKMLHSFIRGRVMFIDNEEEDNVSCDIFALDYGYFEKSVQLGDLRKTLHSNDVPPLAMHCQLAECEPLKKTWCKKAIESMKFFIGKEKANMVIKDKGPHSFIVELFNSCPEDISTMLAYVECSTLGSGNNMISRFTTIRPDEHYYKVKHYEVDEVLTVRVLSGDSLKAFFVAEVDEYKQYIKRKDDFTRYCKIQDNILSEDVRVGMAAGALLISTNTYERALVMEVTVPEEKVRVLLVDSGKFVEIPISRLKPIKNQVFFHPAAAIFCSAEESQAWDNRLHKFLYPGYEFNIKITQMGEQFKTPHIVQISPIKNS